MTASDTARDRTWSGVTPLPFDSALPALQNLCDPASAWPYMQQALAEDGFEEPERLRVEQIRYRPGNRAIVGYLAERQWEQWTLDARPVVELNAKREPRSWVYPNDPRLPGLPHIAAVEEASELLRKYANLRPKRLTIERARYRAGSRGVVRYALGYRASFGEIQVYARAMLPDRVPRLARAASVVSRAGFVIPEIVGTWEEGGVAWLTGAPGITLRDLVQEGSAPPPEAVLSSLLPLWAEPPDLAGSTLNVTGALKATDTLLTQVLTDEAARETYARLRDVLLPFAASWSPASSAHNDLHDDQIVVTGSGKLALVDFEEAGAGDPQIDVANMLAHLRWMTHFGKKPRCAAYRDGLRTAALALEGFDDESLSIRECLALVRLCSNGLMQAKRDWPAVMAAGLQLASDALEGVEP